MQPRRWRESRANTGMRSRSRRAVGAYPRCSSSRRARVPVAKLPAAFADDAEAREEIARLAIARATANYRRYFERIILVGDSDCDVATGARLGLPFVGIATDGHDTALRAAGAERVLQNYEFFAAFVRALEAAGPPGIR